MSEFLDRLVVSPIADGEQWCIEKPFRYRSNLLLAGREDNIVTVPAGFLTDFASVPRFIQDVLPPWNRYGPAAIVHDRLYYTQELRRELADAILREAMSLLGVDAQTIVLIYNAVRVFGAQAWEEDARIKRSGYNRSAPLDRDLPPYASPV